MPTRLQQFAPTGQYAPFHLAAAQATASPVGADLATTSATAIPGGGVSTTITLAGGAAAARALRVGQMVTIAGGVGTPEQVRVASRDAVAGTLTAVFAQAHSGTYRVTSQTAGWLGRVLINAAGSGMTLTLYNGDPAVASTAPGYGVVAAVAPVAGAPLA